jgi:hypothetical protein
MGLQCNIDAKGKRVRLINGIILLILALAVAGFWAWPTHLIFAWGVAIFLFISGSFVVFEARAGWCALRAMGIRTKI